MGEQIEIIILFILTCDVAYIMSLASERRNIATVGEIVDVHRYSVFAALVYSQQDEAKFPL